MFDPKQLLDQFLGSRFPGTGTTVRGAGNTAVDTARKHPMAAGALAAVLLGTGAGRGLTGEVLKLGGLAAIAGLGYQAYKNYQNGNRPGTGDTAGALPALSDARETGFHVDAEAADPNFAITLVRAMVAAAASDGHIDATERQHILGKFEASGVDRDARDFLSAELQNPAGIEDLTAAAASEEQKVEIYTASRLAIDPDTRAERGYLDQLAGRLGLPDALVEHIEASVESAKA